MLDNVHTKNLLGLIGSLGPQPTREGVIKVSRFTNISLTTDVSTQWRVLELGSWSVDGGLQGDESVTRWKVEVHYGPHIIDESLNC